jgi:hypothetical protein
MKDSTTTVSMTCTEASRRFREAAARCPHYKVHLLAQADLLQGFGDVVFPEHLKEVHAFVFGDETP